MRILLSNDDGVHAPGLQILADELSGWADITVMAPDRDRSAASNSLTLDAPLRVTKQTNGFYMVNGTPTDCVHIAMTGYFEEPFDLVIAGINAGANLGDDVVYSGTVAAAVEGRNLGFPAIAVSLVNESKKCRYYDTAAKMTVNLLKKILSDPLPAKTIFNVNVPDLPISEIKGIQLARLGARHIAEDIVSMNDPRGYPIYWIGPAGGEQDAGPGTDFYAINQKYVSITPIRFDLTDYHALDKLSNWSNGLSLSA